MNFEVYSERLVTYMNFALLRKSKKITQKQFQIVNEAMNMKLVNKTQFAGVNDKRYYFHDGIVFLPFGHFLLEKVRKEKENHHSKLHIEVKNETYKFLEMEGKGVHLCERLGILRSIYSQLPMLYELNSNVIANFIALKNTRELIINGCWK